MATLRLINNTVSVVTIVDVGSFVIPASGDEIFTNPALITRLCQSDDLRALLVAGTLTANDGVSNLTLAQARVYLADLWARVGYDANPSLTRIKYQFGRNIAVPTAGTLALLCPGSSTVGYRMNRAGTITGASIQVSAADATRTYILEVRVNGLVVATVPLALSAPGNATAALSIAVVVGDVITATMLRTSASGASTFASETAFVEVTEQ